MNLIISNILPICLLMELGISMRNFHFPHGYFHGLAMHDNYPHYDSYGSDNIVLRSRRNKHHRHRANSDYSDSGYNNYKWECKCSCAKCRKPKTKSCCKEFCEQQCAIQNNILVVPYPVPFMVLNQSASLNSISPISSTNTTIEPTTRSSVLTTPQSRRTLADTASTFAFFGTKSSFKRFRIVQDKQKRRNMGNNGIRSANLDRLPKYGIVPIPENLAISLMQQIRDDQRNDQLRKRLNLEKNLLDYADLPIA